MSNTIKRSFIVALREDGDGARAVVTDFPAEVTCDAPTEEQARDVAAAKLVSHLAQLDGPVPYPMNVPRDGELSGYEGWHFDWLAVEVPDREVGKFPALHHRSPEEVLARLRQHMDVLQARYAELEDVAGSRHTTWGGAVSEVNIASALETWMERVVTALEGDATLAERSQRLADLSRFADDKFRSCVVYATNEADPRLRRGMVALARAGHGMCETAREIFVEQLSDRDAVAAALVDSLTRAAPGDSGDTDVALWVEQIRDSLLSGDAGFGAVAASAAEQLAQRVSDSWTDQMTGLPAMASALQRLFEVQQPRSSTDTFPTLDELRLPPEPPSDPHGIRAPVQEAAEDDAPADVLAEGGLAVFFDREIEVPDEDAPRLVTELLGLAGEQHLGDGVLVHGGRTEFDVSVVFGDQTHTTTVEDCEVDDELLSFLNELLAERGAPGRLCFVDEEENYVAYLTPAEQSILTVKPVP